MATASLQIASQTEKGSPHPLGATPDRQGVNFSLFSSSATAVELLLFKRHDDPKPYQTIQLDPNVNKTFHFWHVYVKGFSPGTHYAYRVDGPRSVLILDPFENRMGYCVNVLEGRRLWVSNHNDNYNYSVAGQCRSALLPGWRRIRDRNFGAK